MARPLTTPQAAEILGITDATVRILADSGELPHRKTVGGHRRFLEEDVRALRLDRDTKNRSGAAAKAVTWRRAVPTTSRTRRPT
jgi:excisionase family DNA binding protein